MEAVAKPQRSSSLDLGKSPKFEFAPDRNRNDSGCFEDFDIGPTGSHHDPVITYWDEAVYQWSERARYRASSGFKPAGTDVMISENFHLKTMVTTAFYA
jgi:hypothetical protein